MANQNVKIGEIYLIGKTQSISCKNGNTLTKRDLWLSVNIVRNGAIVGTTYPKFSFSGQKCAALDQFKNNDSVTVFFDVEGRFYDAGKNQDGTTIWKHSNDINGYNIMSIDEYNAKYNGGTRHIDSNTPSAEELAKQMFGNAPEPQPQQAAAQAPKDDLPF